MTDAEGNVLYDASGKPLQKWVHEGVGEKREGEVVFESYDEKTGMITVKPTKGNYAAGPADSGGPLLYVNEDGNACVYGVTANQDATNLIHTSEKSVRFDP